MNRQTQITAFLAAHGWDKAGRTLVAGDASNRRYDRLRLTTGEAAILMNAPQSAGEDVRPFIKMARYLRQNGLSAPEIYAESPDLGLLLIEDLGDDIFARILETQPELEHMLYEAATDVLLHLHRSPTLDLPIFDATLMTTQSALVFDWYQLGTLGKTDPNQRAAFEAEMFRQLEPLDDIQKVVIQRDYHAENLLWLPDRKGVTRVGLLDFQDALLAHPAYDLVSILQDARRDVDPQTETDMINHYLKNRPIRGFQRAYVRLGLQRNLRILGIFARLAMEKGKAHYIDYIPRVWGHIQRMLHEPGLEHLADLINMSFQAPDTTVLNRLKAQCGRNPLP